jgi:hypothetical protein
MAAIADRFPQVEGAAVAYDDNPFAAPQADILVKDRGPDPFNDAWRHGELLVVRKGVELTDRCLKCAAPTNGYQDRFSRSLSWHRPFWFSLLFLNVLLYIIVAYCVSGRARVTVALCPHHRKKRARAIAFGIVDALAGLGMITAVGILSDTGTVPSHFLPIAGATGIVLVVVGLLGGVSGSRVLVPKRIDKQYVWLGNVSPDYLATLPDWHA